MGLVAATILFAAILSVVMGEADTSVAPAWAAPQAMAMRRVSQTTGSQAEPVLFNNLDCTTLTYRLVASSTMQTGCFTDTAFGLMDSDSDTVIFNGTDEGLPLLPHTPHQIMAPWPRAMDLVGLDPTDGGGVLISLYKNPLASSQDQHNLLGQITAKQLTRAPDITLKDPTGKALIINPQTLTFSDNGSWLVAETLGGAFIRINLASLAMVAFAPAYGSQGSPALLKSRVTITDDGRYAAVANDVAGAFTVYDLSTCDGLVNGLHPQNCHSYNYWPFVRQQINGLQSVRHLRFVDEGLLSFDAYSSNTANNGIYELAPTSSITYLTGYIGLGDSYTSGEGAFDYLDGTDTADDHCHLSRHAYPLLLTHDLFGSSSGHSVACSGAEILDIGSNSLDYRSQVAGVPSLRQLQQSQPLLLESVETNFIPGYIAQHRFVQRWQPRVVTVSIGGNDVGFGNLVQECIEPHVSRHASDSTCYNTYEDRLELSRLIDRTVPKWTALYKQLKREDPGVQLYAIGYPQLVADTGTCGLNVQLNKSELEFAESLIDYLNHAVQKAAGAAGVSYVDISQALAGHRLCEAAGPAVAVNGLTAGTDAGILGLKVFGKESYHPNILGQALMEQMILKQTHNLTDTMVSASGSDSTPPVLLQAAPSGRPINTLVPVSGFTAQIVQRSQPTAFHADGAVIGLRPSTTYTVHLDGASGVVLGYVTSDALGTVDGSLNIPVATSGGHTVDLTGLGQDGQTIDVRQPIYVAASAIDTDGDGFEDITDSCPGAINSGQDTDQDGIDDICDGLIFLLAPTSSGPPPLGAVTSWPADKVSDRPDHPAENKQSAVLGAATITPDKPSSGQAKMSEASPVISHIPRLRYFSWLWLLALLALLLLLIMKKFIKKPAFRLQWWHESVS